MKAVVTHGGGCRHEAESWTHALSMALNHAGKNMNVPSRNAVIPLLMKGEDVWHDGVLFQGKVER